MGREFDGCLEDVGFGSSYGAIPGRGGMDRRVMASNHESSSDGASSSVAKGRRDSASGPWCRSAGTCTRVKLNINIPCIQRLIAALGCKSGSFNIPLMYLASTSTYRFLAPIIKILHSRSAR